MRTSTSSPAAPSRRSAFGPTVVLLAALVVAGLVGAAPAMARPAQDPVPTTTEFQLDTTAPPSTATPTTAGSGTTSPTTSRPLQEADTTQIDKENRRFTMVIVGLLAVAAALALLTIRYWRVTKPGRRKGKARREVDDLDEDELFVTGPTGGDDDVPTAPRSHRSRQAVAGADHAGADDDWEPMATGEQERVSGQVPRATSRPSVDQRAQALGVGESSP